MQTLGILRRFPLHISMGLHGKLLAGTLVFIACIAALIVLHIYVAPGFTNLSYSVGGEIRENASLPLQSRNPDKKSEIRLTLDLSAMHMSVFNFWARDCIESLSINGQRIVDPSKPFCGFPRAFNVDVSRFIHAGTNELEATVINSGGRVGFNIWPNNFDFYVLLIRGLILSLTIVFGVFLIAVLRIPSGLRLAWLIVIGGVCVRLIYFYTTPYTIRGHDTAGHIEYVEYVAQTLSIPDGREGWESYQSPLYYIIAGHLLRIVALQEMENFPAQDVLQFLGLFSSIGALLIAFKIGLLLFRHEKESFPLLIYLSLIISIPSDVFIAASISNDVLYQLMALAMFWFVLHWWRSSADAYWFLAVLYGSLSVLCKATGIVLLAGLYALFIFFRGYSWKRKLWLGSVSTGLFLLLTGWLFILRVFLENQTNPVGNVESLPGGLLIPSKLSCLLTFNPVEVLSIPLNNPMLDSARRQYFWEYFFRSKYFGEFPFDLYSGVFLSAILCLAILGMIPMFRGMYLCLRNNLYKTLPLFIILLFQLTAMLALRLVNPYSVSQDYRYVLLIGPIVAFFAAKGVLAFPKSLKVFFALVLVSLSVTCMVFLLGLYFEPPVFLT